MWELARRLRTWSLILGLFIVYHLLPAWSVWHLRHSIEMDAFNEIESAIYRLCSVSVSGACSLVRCCYTPRSLLQRCPRVPLMLLLVLPAFALCV